MTIDSPERVGVPTPPTCVPQSTHPTLTRPLLVNITIGYGPCALSLDHISIKREYLT